MASLAPAKLSAAELAAEVQRLKSLVNLAAYANNGCVPRDTLAGELAL